MAEILPLLHQMTPGAYGIWTLVIMLAAYLAREWRETRKLSAEDRQARREGYARQVENLQKENRALRGDIARLHADHDAYRRLCQAETDQLRKQVIDLEHEVAGFKRERDTAQIYEIRGQVK